MSEGMRESGQSSGSSIAEIRVFQQAAATGSEFRRETSLEADLEASLARIDSAGAKESVPYQSGLSAAQALNDIEAERKKYRELFDSVPEGILVTTRQGTIREANAAAVRLLQPRTEDLVGRLVGDCLAQGDWDQLESGLEKLSERSRTVRWAVRLSPSRGCPFNAEVAVTLLGESPEEPTLRWMIREVAPLGLPDPLFQQACQELKAAHESAQDVTMRRLVELEETNRRLELQIAERRRVEDEIVNRSRELERRLERRTVQYQDASRAQESIARFLGDVCSNPLRALDSQARMVCDRWGHSLPPEGRKQVNSVLTKTQQLNELLESVAVYARVSKQPLQRRAVDTAALLSEALQSLESEHEGRCVELRIGDLPVCDADPDLLRLVFTHLLSNALKFTRTREAAVIEAASRKEGSGFVWSVRDNGVGFRKDQMHRLFQPFQRLHRTQGYDGAGVGLATVSRIIGRHEGRIWAEPCANGNGAAFFFTLGQPAPSSGGRV